jgi:hypothetical protein
MQSRMRWCCRLIRPLLSRLPTISPALPDSA